MVKSFNEENVRQCMEDVCNPQATSSNDIRLTLEQGIWTTQLQNAEVFANAFAHCKNVILFFSVNKSKAFQGYVSATIP
jgi:hypothetical protein